MAIKCLHEHLASELRFTDMFLDEAKIASFLRHPNVATVLDYEADDEGHFIVQEYLAGKSFAEIRRRAERSPMDRRHHSARIARALSDACEGIHAAHEMTDRNGHPLDLVHRDIAPDNLFLTFDGVAKIIDFGVASSSIQLHETQAGTVKGKLSYLPPEALSGTRVDRRADVWALGVVAWEMMTGKRLFRRKTQAETLQAVLFDAVVAPSSVNADVPREFDGVILKALERERDRRFSTAREFGRELLEVLHTTGHIVHASDLSAWLDELFPAGRQQSQRLIQRAIDAAPVRPIRIQSQTSTVEKDDEITSLEQVPASGVGRPGSTKRTPPDQRHRNRRPLSQAAVWTVLLAICVFALAMVLGFIGAHLFGDSDPRSRSAASRPASPPLSERAERAEREAPMPRPTDVAQSAIQAGAGRTILLELPRELQLREAGDTSPASESSARPEVPAPRTKSSTQPASGDEGKRPRAERKETPAPPQASDDDRYRMLADPFNDIP